MIGDPTAFVTLRIGTKELFVLPVEGDPDRLRVLCDCDVYPTHVVEITMTAGQFEEIKRDRCKRRPIAAIFPEVGKELRELLISGTTPAEFDDLFGEVQPAEKYAGYKLASE